MNMEVKWEMAPLGFDVPSVGTTTEAGNLESGAVSQAQPYICVTLSKSSKLPGFLFPWGLLSLGFLFKLALFGVRGKP